MVVPQPRIALPGSALAAPSARCLGPLPPLELIDAVVRLRRPLPGDGLVAVALFGADHGLRVVAVDAEAPAVVLRGPVLAMSRAFGVQLRAYAGPEGPFRARRGMLLVPAGLVGLIDSVDGLDARPVDAPRHPAELGPAPLHPLSPRNTVSAAPRDRVGRERSGPAGAAGPAVPAVARGDGPAPGSGLAVVLRFPVRHVSAPPDRDRGPASRPGAITAPVARPLHLATARLHRRGPLVRAAVEQRARRLARSRHPAGTDR